MKTKQTNSSTKNIAWFFLLIFCFEVFYPSVGFAGGPDQPEVKGFTPISVSDMVDPFTGDFTYNIPLISIDGYPLNLVYNSGVSMDEEASWVGLGWSLHTGSINRSMRGIPDDFNQDLITKTVSMKKNVNIGADFGASVEIIGLSATNALGLSANASVGINYSNYTGFGTEFSFGPSFKYAASANTKATAGFSLSGSSENGASFSPSIGLSYNNATTESEGTAIGGNIGASMNSRKGLQQISFSGSINKAAKKTEDKKNDDRPKGIKLQGIDHSQITSGSGSFDTGLASYTPSSGPLFAGLNFTGSVSASGSLWGVDAQGNIAINVSKQWIPDDLKTIESRAYGYMHQEKGQIDSKGLLDFNRDNDGSFTKYSKDLPSAFQTYDIFSINAQGTGGSFRPFRNDAGFVFDPMTSINSTMANFGVEVGAGAIFDLSVDIVLGETVNTTGMWSDKNSARNLLGGLSTANNKIVPPFSLVDANELAVDFDQTIPSNFANSNAAHFSITGDNPKTGTLTNSFKFESNQSSLGTLSTNKRTARVTTNNQLYFLTVQEAYRSTNGSSDGLGISNYASHFSNVSNMLPPEVKDHHIGEVTQLGQDGRRYIFGLPAYNTLQDDVTFAIGSSMFGGNPAILPSDYYSGIVGVDCFGTEASVSNAKGIDHYFSKTKTPGYSHSFMLTSILSDDYIDSDETKGPSKNDLGSYVKFEYETVSGHAWKTPVGNGNAYYNEGMITNENDDKASYVFGVKNLYYVQKIKTKNQILVFELTDRADGESTPSPTEGSANAKQKRIKKITLYNLNDVGEDLSNIAGAVKLQEVEFIYNYELCQGYPLNNGTDIGAISNEGGKLTLKEVIFRYQGSNKMKPRSYKFDYGVIRDNQGNVVAEMNPEYNLKAQDRWGSFKPNYSLPFTSADDLTLPMSNSDFPYAIQDADLANQYAHAWALTDISLPSGGTININYEADDYGFVQHKPAARMFKIIGVEDYVTSGPEFVSVSSLGEENKSILFELNDQNDEDMAKYGIEGQQIYFRCLTKMVMTSDPKTAEYVSGYGVIKGDIEKVQIVPGGEYFGKIKLAGVNLKDNSPEIYNPISKAAILFGRTQLSNSINDYAQVSQDMTDNSGNEGALNNFANSIISAASSLGELLTGPNIPIYLSGKGREIVTHKSFVRLSEPSGRKTGGGSRVHRIVMNDAWDEMSGASSSKYGQEYKYVTAEGKSSGVASYEPQLGGDENPWHTAYFINYKYKFATDDKLFIEDPIMESQFPSPSVGYSRVEISNLKYENVTRTATGKIVKEFFTARDFPTIVSRSNVQIQPKNNLLPVGKKFQLLNASQGFVIELNDMHGKPRKEEVFGEGQTSPMSSVEYRYKMSPVNIDGAQNYKLTNAVNVIDDEGQLLNAEIGVRYDVVSDFRESETNSTAIRSKLGVNGLQIGPVPLPLLSIWPKTDRTQNRFRSATVNKTINRFGILEETIANQDGSIVSTKNLAYDAQTGQVLVTETKTNFNDDIYSLNYPAYWHYSSFGQASKNILYSYLATTVQSNGFISIPPAQNYFEEGDEVAVFSNSNPVKKGWVVEKSATGIVLIDKAGNPINGNNLTLKVIRSGNRNKQSTSMASATTFVNPMGTLPTNQFSKVLNASAVEFKDAWKTYCPCFDNPATQSTNPYVLGTKGNWRPWRSFTHLTDRTQSNYNGNTNIRVDGMFAGYNPYYYLDGGKWKINGQNWTYVSEVTEFSPNGMTLETKDALGRYSSNTMGFNNTLVTGTAVNTQLKQLAVSGFEDAGQNNCTDDGFFSKPIPGDVLVVENAAHTGRKSIKVAANSSVTFKNILDPCEAAAPCDLSTTFASNNTVQINGGSAPYEVTFSSNSGGQAYMINASLIQYYIPTGASSNESINVTVRDARGCEIHFTISPKKPISPAPFPNSMQSKMSVIYSPDDLHEINLFNY